MPPTLSRDGASGKHGAVETHKNKKGLSDHELAENMGASISYLYQHYGHKNVENDSAKNLRSYLPSLLRQSMGQNVARMNRVKDYVYAAFAEVFDKGRGGGSRSR